MLNAILIGCIMVVAAAVFGAAFFFGAKSAIAKFEEMQRIRRSQAVEREHAARRVRMARYSMADLAGTKTWPRERWGASSSRSFQNQKGNLIGYTS